MKQDKEIENKGMKVFLFYIGCSGKGMQLIHLLSLDAFCLRKKKKLHCLFIHSFNIHVVPVYTRCSVRHHGSVMQV